MWKERKKERKKEIQKTGVKIKKTKQAVCSGVVEEYLKVR